MSKVIGVVFGVILLGCAIVIGVTYRWHTRLQSHYSMLKRWSFHPPHDPDKVVINEEDNKYFSFKGFQGFNTSSFRLSNSTTFEIVEKEIDEYFDDAKRNSNQGFHVPDLLISTDLNNDTDAPIRQNKVMYRKPSKYIRPKLSLVEEEDDDENATACTSVRSSFRGSMVVHDDYDSE